MINTTFYKAFNLFIKQLFCLVLIFNVVGKTFVVDLLHESFDLFELCDSTSEEKEMDCKEKELEDYEEEKKFLEDIDLEFKYVNEYSGIHYYEHDFYFNIHTSIVLPPPELRS